MKFFIIGLLIPIICTTSLRLLEIEYTTMWYFLPLLIGYGILGWLAWSGNWIATLKNFSLVYVSIPIAILIDVTFDWFVWSYDRNLFPIEIVMIFIVCQIPLFLGAFTRKKIERDKNR